MWIFFPKWTLHYKNHIKFRSSFLCLMILSKVQILEINLIFRSWTERCNIQKLPWSHKKERFYRNSSSIKSQDLSFIALFSWEFFLKNLFLFDKFPIATGTVLLNISAPTTQSRPSKWGVGVVSTLSVPHRLGMIIECFSELTCDELSSRYITVDSLLGPGWDIWYY